LHRVLADLLSLTKPRITAMVLVTTLGAMVFAGGSDRRTETAALVATALIVAASNVLNCWLERDVDALMTRTRCRPLPSGRLSAGLALAMGVALAAASVSLFALRVNALTTALAVIACLLYVGVYTPLKRISTAALWVGAIPGALPPLLGTTAARGRIDALGLSLFAILYCWQLPHFIAIAVIHEQDYASAGFRVISAVRGRRVAMAQAVAGSLLLVVASAVPNVLHTAGPAYLTVALALGGTMVALATGGWRRWSSPRWPRWLFLTSLLYLPAIMAALTLDSALRIVSSPPVPLHASSLGASGE
jgi:protoheme IX farnesyltransferase